MRATLAGLSLLAAFAFLMTGLGVPLGIALLLVAFAILASGRRSDPAIGTAAVRRRLAGDTPVPAKPRPAGPPHSVEDKRRVTAPSAPALTDSLANAVTVKDAAVFMLTAPGGDIPRDGRHGLGIYFRDCRYVSACALTLQGTSPELLAWSASAGFAARHVLTNRAFVGIDGSTIAAGALEITWEHVADAQHRCIHQRLRFRNRSPHPANVRARLAFRAPFEDIFVARGLVASPAVPPAPVWPGDGHLCFSHRGEDAVARDVHIRFAPNPSLREGAEAEFDVLLTPERTATIAITIALHEGPEVGPPPPDPDVDVETLRATRSAAVADARASLTRATSSSLLLNAALDQALTDLHVLELPVDGASLPAAGLPWLAALLGRESLVTAVSMLAFSPDLAERTLRVLAQRQGMRLDPWHDEQPGRIVQEVRLGPLSRAGRLPHDAYFGSMDATPLFLILLERHAAWTGRLELFAELRGNVERALDWIDHHADSDADGYIDDASDADDSILGADLPIARLEDQAYAYRAKTGLADLYARVGDGTTSARLRAEADALRFRFNRDYWMDDARGYARALQAGGRPYAAASAIAGRALWAGIADEEKARAVARRLMQPDLWSGWGVRTLSTAERPYNPLGHQLGAVWPYENAMIAAGLRRYGHVEAAARILNGLVEAAGHFPQGRLPECFAGIPREECPVPVPSPMACHPAAPAAAALPYLLETTLGLTPYGFEHRLEIRGPRLPPFVEWLELSRLRVGPGSVDLLFHRVDGVCEVEVVRHEHVAVRVQPSDTSQPAFSGAR